MSKPFINIENLDYFCSEGPGPGETDAYLFRFASLDAVSAFIAAIDFVDSDFLTVEGVAHNEDGFFYLTMLDSEGDD